MKNTQPLRRKLEKILDRTICDDTWHKLRKQLLANGIEYSEFDTAFQILKFLHAGKSGNNYKLVPPNEAFIPVWNHYKKMAKGNTKMTCLSFLTGLIYRAKKNGEKLPKDRFKNGKRIGFNTIWYRWFSNCGIPFEQEKEYPISKLIGVVFYLKSWQINQAKKLTNSVFDAEVA